MINRSALAAATLVVLVVAVRLAAIPESYWQYRDDGVITLSHARNLATQGHIGVNPSGGIVEGISAPLQTLLATVVFSVFPNINYKPYATSQTLVSTIILGLALFWLMHKWARLQNPSSHPRFALAGTCGVTAIAVACYQFIAWHGSGMENAITHAMLAGSLAVLTVSLIHSKMTGLTLVLPVLLTISRLDAIIHVLPLALTFALVYRSLHASNRGFLVPVTVLCAFLLITALRYLYFGDIYSNTALAQGLNISLRIHQLVAGTAALLDEGTRAFTAFVIDYALYLAPPALFTLVALTSPGQRPIAVALCLLLCSLLASATLSAWLIGDARLYVSRTVSWLGLVNAIAIGAALIRLAQKCTAHDAKAASIALCSCLTGAIAIALLTPAPFFMCCTIPYATDLLDRIRPDLEASGFTRPMIANPDLGKLSWAKSVNVLDIGSLGDPVLGRLRQGPRWRDDALLSNDYIFELRQPDLIDFFTHTRMCDYKLLVTDPRFLQRYRPYDNSPLVTNTLTCRIPPQLNHRRWIIRTIVSHKADELALAAKLYHNPGLEPIRAALSACKIQSDCHWVARALYRVLPEIKTAGLYDDVTAETRDLPPEDRAMIGSSHNAIWYRDILTWLVQRRMTITLSEISNPNSKILFEAKSVTLYDTPAAYIFSVTVALKLAERWFVHIVPADGSALSAMDHEASSLTISDHTRSFIVLPKDLFRAEARKKPVKGINLGHIDQSGTPHLIQRMELGHPI